MTLTKEEAAALIARLEEPFDPDDVSFLPQAIDYKGKTAVAAAYADPRTYYQRLDEVVGPQNWSTELEFLTTPYVKTIRGKRGKDGAPDEPDRTAPGNKVICRATVHVTGLGSKSSSGEKDASDENAATSAEAQAVKRAISQFGPGKYFYHLGKQSYPYDTFKKTFTKQPTLPDHAVHVPCETCSKRITGIKFTQPGSNVEQVRSAHDVLNNAKNKYGKRLCADCQKELAAAASKSR